MLSLYFDNDTRYYRLTLEKDLLDFWVVVCSYGGKKNSLGNVKKYPYIQLCDALKKMKSVTKTRIQRKYLLQQSMNV